MKLTVAFGVSRLSAGRYAAEDAPVWEIKRGHSAFQPVCGRRREALAHRSVMEIVKTENVPVRFSN
jgi:hypothetical protein